MLADHVRVEINLLKRSVKKARFVYDNGKAIYFFKS